MISSPIIVPVSTSFNNSSIIKCHNSLKLYYQNVRGLRTKTKEFFLAVIDNDYDIIVLTETWLSSDIYDAELFSANYVVFRYDRALSRGGGVLIAVKSIFICKTINLDLFYATFQFSSLCGAL